MDPNIIATASEVQLAVLGTRLTAQDLVLSKLEGICTQTLAQATKTNGRVDAHDVLLSEFKEDRKTSAKDISDLKAWVKGTSMVFSVFVVLGGIFAWMHSAGLIKF